MKKYKNVKAIRARICDGYSWLADKDGIIYAYCRGVREPFRHPPCKGYKCKCTEYKYKRGKLI